MASLSGRALLVEVETGREVATAVHHYPDGVIEEFLPGDKRRLPPDTALQNPDDYLQVLSVAIPKVLRAAKMKPRQAVSPSFQQRLRLCQTALRRALENP